MFAARVKRRMVAAITLTAGRLSGRDGGSDDRRSELEKISRLATDPDRRFPASIVIGGDAIHLLLALVLGCGLQPSGPLLSRLAGQWTGTGTVSISRRRSQMSWSLELGGQFHATDVPQNEMPKTMFEGSCVYRAHWRRALPRHVVRQLGDVRPLDAATATR